LSGIPSTVPSCWLSGMPTVPSYFVWYTYCFFMLCMVCLQFLHTLSGIPTVSSCFVWYTYCSFTLVVWYTYCFFMLCLVCLQFLHTLSGIHTVSSCFVWYTYYSFVNAGCLVYLMFLNAGCLGHPAPFQFLSLSWRHIFPPGIWLMWYTLMKQSVSEYLLYL